MRWKEGIIYLLITWILIYFICHFFKIPFDLDVPFMVTIMPLLIMIFAFIFGVFYIRNTPKNQSKEGFILGIFFIIGFMVLDGISFLVLGTNFKSFYQYLSQIVINCVWFPIIFTILGYAADFKIQLN